MFTIHTALQTLTRGGRADLCSSTESKTLDGNLKDVAKRVFNVLKECYPDLTFEKRYRSSTHQAGCAPDGGLFYYKGKLIVASEAKHQGATGNAIERWYKNAFILRQVNPSITYLTFATGEGAQENAVICKSLSPAHPHGYNNYVIGENVCFTSVKGFDSGFIGTQLIESIIDQINIINE